MQKEKIKKVCDKKKDFTFCTTNHLDFFKNENIHFLLLKSITHEPKLKRPKKFSKRKNTKKENTSVSDSIFNKLQELINDIQLLWNCLKSKKLWCAS